MALRSLWVTLCAGACFSFITTASSVAKCKSADKPVLVVHIPKSGGTTLCHNWKAANWCTLDYHTSFHNCLIGTDGDAAEWCCKPHSMMREKTCKERIAKGKKYGMMERYMDMDPKTNRTLFCDGISYGIILRDPVERAISHLHNFLALEFGNTIASQPMKKPTPSWYSRAVPVVRKSKSAVDLEKFFDNLGALPPNTTASETLITDTLTNFAHYSQELEKSLYKLNEFTFQWLIAMRNFFRSQPASEIVGFFDKLDQVPAYSSQSNSLITATFGVYHRDLELSAYKMNAFTSNYHIRMLLGRQLGDPPLQALSSSITADAVANAKWALDQFDFVLRSEDMRDPATAAKLKKWTGVSELEAYNVAEKDDLYQKLSSNAVLKEWLVKRNAADIALVEGAPRSIED